ncbi:MAG: glycoside hydrolase family 99-like domain-containing protein [Syntrophomonas sp.]
MEEYCKTILSIPNNRSKFYRDYKKNEYSQRKALICAYYLTQYYPTEKNNLWWGKGTTEWTNVSKSVPQYAGHYQPKLPGELGFYDLRLPENMYRQIDLATNYGVDAFAFYYYWFNGERALEHPLDMFLEHQDMDIQFCVCWCNEDWTKRYSGTNNEVLLSIGKTQESYIRFIDDVIPLFKDKRYLKIDNKFVLIIYRPSEIPKCQETIIRWREKVKQETGADLYLIASQERRIISNWVKRGFNAVSQFQPASCIDFSNEITKNMHIIREKYYGHVYDYEHTAKDAISYLNKGDKIYPAVMPMWDNTSRRDDSGVIFENSSPELYRKWLDDAIKYVSDNANLEANIVFINAWNEWGEGAYLEPDRAYGYAYLEETYKANCHYR